MLWCPLIVMSYVVYMKNWGCLYTKLLKYMFIVEEGGLFDYITTLLSENEGCVKGVKAPLQ